MEIFTGYISDHNDVPEQRASSDTQSVCPCATTQSIRSISFSPWRSREWPHGRHVFHLQAPAVSFSTAELQTTEQLLESGLSVSAHHKQAVIHPY